MTRKPMTLTMPEILAALHALDATDAYRGSIDYAIGYAERHPGDVAVFDWLPAMVANRDRWYVRHCGRTYPTDAVTEAEAVNNIRFRLYGRTPANECGPFAAINPARVILGAVSSLRLRIEADAPRDLFGAKISKFDVAARLRRMAS